MVHLKTNIGHILEIGYPLIEGMRACVHIGMDEERTHTRIAALRKGIIGLTLLLVAVGIAAGVLVSRRMVRPLSDLADAMCDFGERNKDGELEFRSGGREIAHLTRAFNRMVSDHKRAEAEKTRLEEQYHQAQKVESIGRLAGGVAHDLNNLLTPILGYSEMLLDDLGPDDARRESVDEILRAGFRARDLVRQLLAFSRKQPLEFKILDLNEAIEGFGKLLQRVIHEDIKIEIIPSPDIRMVRADVRQIEQVIMNLAINAQDAMPKGGKLIIETAIAELDEDYAAKHQGVEPGEYIMLAISDTGCGMDDETCEHMFEPFFTTKGYLGTGLGLATV